MGFDVLVNAYRNEWENCDIKEEVLDVCCGDIDISIVVWGTFLSGYKNWMTKNIPALGNSSPEEMLKSEAGIIKLKDFLMCFPR